MKRFVIFDELTFTIKVRKDTPKPVLKQLRASLRRVRREKANCNEWVKIHVT